METNLDRKMETEIDEVTETYGYQALTLSQEQVLLKESPEEMETENSPSNDAIQNTIGDTDTNKTPLNEQMQIPNAKNYPNEQPAASNASEERSIKTSFGTTTTVPSDQSTSTVYAANSMKRRQRKRPSGAQVMKRRRVAKELKALQQQHQNESGRTETVSLDNPETGKTTESASQVAGGAGNSDNGNQTSRDGENPGSTDGRITPLSNQTTSNNSSKRKRKRNKQKNNKKDQSEMEVKENDDKVPNSNTSETNPLAAGSSSNKEAAIVNLKNSETDADSANRDRKGDERHNLSDSVSRLMEFYGTVKPENYVPASVMIDRMRRQAKPKGVKARTPKPNAAKAKKPESDRIDESLRLAIVDVNDCTGGLSKLILNDMEEHLLRALD